MPSRETTQGGEVGCVTHDFQQDQVQDPAPGYRQSQSQTQAVRRADWEHPRGEEPGGIG